MARSSLPPLPDAPASPEAPIVPSRVERRRARRRWYARPFVVIAAVTAIAGGLRFYHPSAPHAYVFDEVYYAKDGCFDAGFPYKDCKLENPGEQTVTVHPPLGRWIIAGSEAAFGNRPFGWRFSSAVAGTLSVALISLLALALFRSVLWAGAAGLLLATESLNFVQSRISMLDIFLALFVIAGFLFLVLDRRWLEKRTPPRPAEVPDEGLHLPPDRPAAPIFRPWRLATGVAFGAAAATKWSGVIALAGAIILAVAWERTRRKEAGLPHPLWEAVRDEGFGIFVFLLIVPIAVYVASYARWWADHGTDIGGWWRLQQSMASYSIHLRAKHPYASPAWSWILMKRPVSYYYQCVRMKGVNCALPAEIIGIGNPLIFWGTVFTLPYALVAWIRKRDWRAGLIVVAISTQWFPWFLAARTNFLFYMTPVTPFMVLAGVYALRDLSQLRIGVERGRPLAPIAGLLFLASIGLFVFFLPVLTGRALSYAAWKARIWFPSWI
ncbi:MAG: phospholipid carrier-dependent glycosyltransferase [Actinobacteria bacterium]|nr:MAG: phospholipid carrier-dependent glycosyltransferase [Actinomycetota bacterium]